VPKAPIHKDGDARCREYDVDHDPFDPAMQTETKSFGVKRGSERTLGPRMLAPDSAHEFGTSHRTSVIGLNLRPMIHFFSSSTLADFAYFGAIELFNPLLPR